MRLQGRGGGLVLVQPGAVELEPGVRLAQLLPGRALGVVEVLQLVDVVGQVEQVGLALQELADQAEALLLREELGDDAQGVGDLLTARIVPGVGQGLVLGQVVPPATQVLAQEGVQRVLAVGGDLAEDVLGQVARRLELTLVDGLALDDGDAPPFARGDDGLVDLVGGQGRAVHHQADVALPDQAGHQQHDLPLRPAVGAPPEACLHHVLQDHLLVGAGHQVDVALHLVEGLLVALSGLQGEAEVVHVGGAEHGLDLGLGVGGEVGEVAELVEAVADQVVQGLAQGRGGRAALRLDRLAGGVVAGLLDTVAPGAGPGAGGAPGSPPGARAGS